MRRIKVGSSFAEDDGTGAQAGLGLAGRVERSNDGGHQGDRAADAAGVAAEDGSGRFIGRRAGQEPGREFDERGSDGNGSSGRDNATGVGRRQNAGGHPGQHREERRDAEPAVRQETVRYSHHQHSGQFRGRDQSRGFADRSGRDQVRPSRIACPVLLRGIVMRNDNYIKELFFTRAKKTSF